MALSNLTAVQLIAEGSEATPGLFNRMVSQLSDNIGAVNQAAISISALSSSTWASIGLTSNSNNSDYIRMVDSSGQRSTYILGSHVGGTADGLNIYDESGSTMLASFSKQSVRFFQPIIGPVFDQGGSLKDTLNAATFGVASDSTETRIQAAVNAASAQGVSRVYLPSTFVPYSGSSVSFINGVQMVREGGEYVYADVRAYGAKSGGTIDCTSAFSAARGSGFPLYVSTGSWFVNVTAPNNTDNFQIFGAGEYQTELMSASSSQHGINLGTGSQHAIIKDLTISTATSLRTSFGITGDGNAYLTIENVFIKSFSNNIHLTSLNEVRLKHVRLFGAVPSSVVTTGCNFYGSHPTGGTGLFIIDGCSLETGKYGAYCETLESPVITDGTCVQQTDTAVYCEHMGAGSSTGPFISSFLVDSSLSCGVFLKKQIATSAANLWVSSRSRGIIEDGCTYSNMGVTLYNCNGWAFTWQNASVQNHVHGSMNGNPGGGLLVQTGCYDNSGIGQFNNNGTYGILALDATAGQPNQFWGGAAGNTTANISIDTKDRWNSTNSGRFTPAMTFGGAAVSMTFSNQVGDYTIREDRYDFNIYVALSAKGSSTGAWVITGLPFASNSRANAFQSVAIDWADQLNCANGVVPMGFISPGGTSINLYLHSAGSSSAATDGAAKATSGFIINGTIHF